MASSQTLSDSGQDTVRAVTPRSTAALWCPSNLAVLDALAARLSTRSAHPAPVTDWRDIFRQKMAA
jgi:hypothetical protein